MHDLVRENIFTADEFRDDIETLREMRLERNQTYVDPYFETQAEKILTTALETDSPSPLKVYSGEQLQRAGAMLLKRWHDIAHEEPDPMYDQTEKIRDKAYLLVGNEARISASFVPKSADAESPIRQLLDPYWRDELKFKYVHQAAGSLAVSYATSLSLEHNAPLLRLEDIRSNFWTKRRTYYTIDLWHPNAKDLELDIHWD